MMSLEPKTIQIPFETYQRLLNHLSVHAPTDTWASQLLLELENEARSLPASLSSSDILSLDDGKTTYSLN